MVDTLEAGGAEKSMLALICNSQADDLQYRVIAIYGRGVLAKDFEYCCGVSYLGITKKYGFVGAARKLGKIISEEQPDLVHAVLFRSEIVARLAMLSYPRIPLIGSFVNDSYSTLRFKLIKGWRGRIKLRGIQFIDALTVIRVSHFLAITEDVKKRSLAALPINGKDIKVIYRGRSLDKYSAAQRPAVKSDRPIFFSSSRLLWRKGYRESLTAIAALDFECRYRIVGTGVDDESIRRFAQSLPNSDRFEFLGYASDVEERLRQADYFLMPSHYEGLGGSLIEAMLCKVPIIASDTTVHREVTGGYALFFTTGDHQDLLRQIKSLPPPGEVSDMVEDAYEYAVRKYDIRSITRQTEEFYREMIGE